MNRISMIGVAAVALLALSGCTDSEAGTESAPASAGATELTPVTVGVIPIADTAPLYLGDAQGFFEDAGWTSPSRPPPAALRSCRRGRRRLPVRLQQRALADGGEREGPRARDREPGGGHDRVTDADFGAIIVKADSPIQSPADLAGKTVSSNSLGNINDTIVRDARRRRRRGPVDHLFVEVPFPDAIAAVDNSQVDAAFVVEPFVTSALEAGDRVISYAYADFDPKLDIAAYFTTSEYVEGNADIVEKFQTAMQQVARVRAGEPRRRARHHRDLHEDPAGDARKIVLPSWPTEMNEDALQKLADAAESYGVLTEAPDLDDAAPVTLTTSQQTTAAAAVPGRRRARRPGAHRAAILGTAGIIGFLLLWEAVAALGLIDPRFLPPASDVLAAAGPRPRRPAFWRSVGRHDDELGDRSRHRRRGRHRARVPHRLEPIPRARDPLDHRVPAADPVRRAHPAGRAALRHQDRSRPCCSSSTRRSGRCCCRSSTASQTSTRSPTTPPAATACGGSAASATSSGRRRCPYLMTGIRLAATVALILAITSELVIGTPASASRSPSPSPAAPSRACTPSSLATGSSASPSTCSRASSSDGSSPGTPPCDRS